MGKKASRDKGYTIPDVTKKAFELSLRRVATQGIVRLFNAVKDYQQRNEETDTAQLAKSASMRKRAQIMADVSKEKFEKLMNSVDKKDRAAEMKRKKDEELQKRRNALRGRDRARQPVQRPMGGSEGANDEF